MISGKIKSVCAGQHTGSFLLCKPACSRSAAAAGADEMVPAPWGSIQNFKDFFVIAGYFLILTGMEGVIFVRMVKRREQNG